MNPESSLSSPRFLSEWSEISKTRNRLPHWQSGRTACFITFRLADSLPEELLSEWRRERAAWLAMHPKPWDAATEAKYHKRFSSRVDQLLDAGHGDCRLAHPEHAAAVADTLTRRDSVDYLLHSWVIMPNHAHVLMSPADEKSLAQVVGGWKRFSATRIHKSVGKSGTLWQKDYFDRLIRDWDHFLNVARYIRRNPSKAQLAEGRFVLFESPWVTRMLS